MWYFFDESGNWQEIERERKKLVIAGVLIKEENTLKDLDFEFSLFRQENNLKEIHATDLDLSQREKLNDLIEKFLKNDNIKVLAYKVDPKLLFQTKLDPDEIYIDYASEIISEMIFQDNNPIIEYDLKFHYTYSTYVLEEMKSRDYYFDRMKRNFFLKDESFVKQKNRIEKIIKKRERDFNLDRIDKKFIFNYLWAEFKLQTKKSFLLREKLKDRVKKNIENICKKFFIDLYEFDLQIEYKHKHELSAGVEFADIVNNLVYNNRTEFLEYIDIKDF